MFIEPVFEVTFAIYTGGLEVDFRIHMIPLLSSLSAVLLYVGERENHMLAYCWYCGGHRDETHTHPVETA